MEQEKLVEKEEFAKVEKNEKGEKFVNTITGNPLFKMELNDGETDFRQLTNKEKTQLYVRYQTAQIQMLNHMMLALNETELLLLKLCEKMGISKEDIEKMLNSEEN